MSEIKRLLHKYLTHDGIMVFALDEKIGDTRWLIEKGYKEDFKAGKSGLMVEGEATEKGKAYFKEHDRLMKYHFECYAKQPDTVEKEDMLKKELREYIKKNPDIDLYTGLNENETFAFRNLYFNR